MGGPRLDVIDTIAATLGASAMVLATQPFDTAKVNLQVTKQHSKCSHRGVWQSLSFLDTNWRVAKKIVSKGGICALWSGTAPALYAYGMEHAVLFTVYEAVLRNVETYVKLDTVIGSAAVKGMCCAISCTTSSFFLAPADAIKCKIQANAQHYSSSWDCLRRVHADSGISSLFRNYHSVLARDSLFFGTYIFVRELLLNCLNNRIVTHQNLHHENQEIGGKIERDDKPPMLAEHYLGRKKLLPDGDCGNNLSDEHTGEDHGIFNLFISGGVAGSVAWCVAAPADLINSRRQAVIALSRDTVKKSRNSLLSELRFIIQHEGPTALFRGSALNILRGFVGYGLFTVVYLNSLDKLRIMWN